jgi:hypothetical protein
MKWSFPFAPEQLMFSIFDSFTPKMSMHDGAFPFALTRKSRSSNRLRLPFTASA